MSGGGSTHDVVDRKGAQDGTLEAVYANTTTDRPAMATVCPFDQDQCPHPGPLTGRRAHVPVEPSPLWWPAFGGDVPAMTW